MANKPCPKGYKRVGSRCFRTVDITSITIFSDSLNNSLSKLTQFLLKR